MAGNASRIGYSSFDCLDAEWINANDGRNFTSFFKPVATASSIAAGYSIDNTFIWDRSRWRSTDGINHNITYDFSGTVSPLSYNYAVIWLPQDRTNAGSPASLTSIDTLEFQTSTTGSFTGEEVTRFTITQSELADFTSFFASYAAPSSSRCLVFPVGEVLSVSTVPYARFVWSMLEVSNVSIAKAALFQMQDLTVVTGSFSYNFVDRDQYTELENGAYNKYRREYRRDVSMQTRYNTETTILFSKLGGFNRAWANYPQLIILDSDSEWSSQGLQLHSFPVRIQNNQNYNISPQYSQQNMYSDTPIQFTEFLG